MKVKFQGTRPLKIIIERELQINSILKRHLLKNLVSRKKTFKKNSYMETLTEFGLEGIIHKNEVIRDQTFKNHTRNYN